MTVKELIKALQNCNPKSSVEIVIRQGATPDNDTWTDLFNDVVEYQEDGKSWVVLDSRA